MEIIIRKAQKKDLSEIRLLISYLMQIEQSNDVNGQTEKIISAELNRH